MKVYFGKRERDTDRSEWSAVRPVEPPRSGSGGFCGGRLGRVCVAREPGTLVAAAPPSTQARARQSCAISAFFVWREEFLWTMTAVRGCEHSG